MGQTERSAPETSSAGVAMGQASVSASPTPSATGGATLEELPSQERSAPLEVGVGTSWSLVRVATLDDTTEEREWGSVQAEVGFAVCALTAVLCSMHDTVAPVDQV